MADVQWCLDQIQGIRSSEDQRASNRESALRFFRSDPDIVPLVKDRSRAVTTDLQDTIAWIMPSLMEIFAGEDDPVNLEPEGPEDVKPVENLNLLVNKQIRRDNDWFIGIHDWIQECLVLKTGVVKYWWKKETKKVRRNITATPEQYAAIAQEPNKRIIEVKENVITPESFDNTLGMLIPAVIKYDLVVEESFTKKFPYFCPVPRGEVGFPADMKSVKTARFFYHRVAMKEYEVVSKYGRGKFNDIKKTVEVMGTTERTETERFRDLGGVSFIYNDKDEDYYIYEVFYVNKDGDPWKVDMCGDIVLEEGFNVYGKPNFEIITPFKRSHTVEGFSVYDLMKELQVMRTTLYRQFFDAISQSNYRRYFVDPTRINMKDLKNNSTTNALIRFTGSLEGAYAPEQKAPLPVESFPFFELLNTEKDYHSGMPRSFQGVQKGQMNETWRGQGQQINQAAQRIKMMARLIAEMGIKPLIEAFVDMNLQFLDEEVHVRLTNQFIPVNPDNIIGKYDVIVNVGLGSINKAERVLHMQQLLGIYAQVYKAGVPVVTSANVHKVLQELVKAMGYKDTDSYVTDPQLTESVQQFMTMIMQHIQSMGPQAMQIPGVAQLIQMGQKIMGMLGHGGAQNTAVNSTEAPQQAAQPFQPMQPSTTTQGGGYFG